MIAFSPRSRRASVGLAAALLAAAAAAPAQTPLCVQGPLPGNSDNRLTRCSPDPDSVQARILPEGVELSWNAPPRATSTYLSAVFAAVGPDSSSKWSGVAPGAEIPTLHLRGAYAAV